MKKSVSVYFCGGTGITIGYHADLQNLKSFVGFANPECLMIDSSDSNIEDSDYPVYTLISSDDGFGKEREQSLKIANQGHVNEILNKLVPNDFNIVVYSISGATGSVIGPKLVKELMIRKKPVVSIVVKGVECKKTAENSRSTLINMAGIAKSTGVPFIFNYHDNQSHDNLTDVNELVKTNLKALLILASGQNTGVDSTDIANFINFTKTTKLEAQLTSLNIFVNLPEDVSQIKAIGLISLLKDRSASSPNIQTLHSAFGWYSESLLSATDKPISDIHFITDNSTIGTTMANLSKQVEHYTAISKTLEDQAFDFDLSEADISL